MNILILLAFAIVLQFPRILSGDIGFVENYNRIDEIEKDVLSSTSYASLNPKVWRFVHGSFSFQKFTNDVNLINELEKHSSEIYHKITLYEFSGIQNLDEDIFVNDLYLLSQKLKVSSTILELFFTVYCNYSWSKYTKLLRVSRAEYLISNDFLFKNDMNALALKVGFNNRVTLYNNFKDFLGRPPSSSK
jgi:AraC-like DNA-binding protein